MENDYNFMLNKFPTQMEASIPKRKKYDATILSNNNVSDQNTFYSQNDFTNDVSDDAINTMNLSDLHRKNKLDRVYDTYTHKDVKNGEWMFEK